MSTSTHVVLGGNGVVGRETVRALRAGGADVTSVGRRPSALEGVRSSTADLLDRHQVDGALRGADVAYLTAGLPYSARVWHAQWPTILRNTIEAAAAHGTHLVYFDNVYAYGHVRGPMIESSPIDPHSKKGRVRAAALDLIDDARRRGVRVTIGRSADFFGPGASTSVFTAFAVDKVAAGKPATWLFDADQPHSLTYTPDIGAALAVLGTAESAVGRTWHLPTAPALTGREYVRLLGGEDAECTVMGSTMMTIGALFNGNARETREMAYQYTSPYIFDSTAFENAFAMTATPIAVSLAATLAASRSADASSAAPRRGRAAATR